MQPQTPVPVQLWTCRTPIPVSCCQKARWTFRRRGNFNTSTVVLCDRFSSIVPPVCFCVHGSHENLKDQIIQSSGSDGVWTLDHCWELTVLNGWLSRKQVFHTELRCNCPQNITCHLFLVLREEAARKTKDWTWNESFYFRAVLCTPERSLTDFCTISSVLTSTMTSGLCHYKHPQANWPSCSMCLFGEMLKRSGG